MEFNVDRHISGQFNHELEQVLSHVFEMGGLVESQLSFSLDAITKTDAAIAAQVRENDKKVNQYETVIDEECTRIIAKRQPAATDLRLILTITKTISDLERIGDECCRVVKVVQETTSSTQHKFLLQLEHLGKKVLEVLSKVLNAFARMDCHQAFSVYQMDKEIDTIYKEVSDKLVAEMMAQPNAIPQIIDILWALRSLERIGDRCQNISEHVIYLIKGRDVRHLERDQIAALVGR